MKEEEGSRERTMHLSKIRKEVAKKIRMVMKRPFHLSKNKFKKKKR